MLEVNALASTLHDAAPGRARSQRAAAHGDGGDRRRRVHLRRSADAAAGEPRRRAAAGAAGRAAARARRGRDLGLDACLAGATPRIDDIDVPRRRPAAGRCAARRSARAACPHQLLVLADVSRPLRDEERQAWQRLIRVIGHEINNSLAPIKSIAGSLESMLAREPLPDDWRRRHAARPGGHRGALRFAQPLHDRVRAAREAAGAAARDRQRPGARPPRRRPRNAAADSRPSRARRHRSAPTPISSSSC